MIGRSISCKNQGRYVTAELYIIQSYIDHGSDAWINLGAFANGPIFHHSHKTTNLKTKPLFKTFCTRLSWTPPLSASGKSTTCIAFILIAVYLWILPVDRSIALRHLAFFPLILLTLWSAWRHRLRLHLPLATPWLVYGSIALFSVTYAADPLQSLGEAKAEIGYGILALMLTATWVRNIVSLERLMILVVVGDALLVGSALFKVIVLDPFWNYPISEINDLLYNGPGKRLYNGVGNFSTYLITVMPLIAVYAFSRPKEQRVWRGALLSLVALNILALFLTGNRMGLFVLLAIIVLPMGFLLLKAGDCGINIRKILPVTLITLIVAGSLTFVTMQERPASSDIRREIWNWAIADIRAAPLTGSGFGRTTLCLKDPKFCQKFRLEHGHNMVLNKGIQMGLPGIAAFLFLLGMTLHALWPGHISGSNKRLWSYALGATIMSIGVFFKNMTDDFFVQHNALLYWALVGAVLGTLAGEREEKTQNDE